MLNYLFLSAQFTMIAIHSKAQNVVPCASAGSGLKRRNKLLPVLFRRDGKARDRGREARV